MGDAADLKATVESLTNALKTLQTTVEANAKAIASLTSDRTSSSGTKPGSVEHHNDWPPKSSSTLWACRRRGAASMPSSSSRTCSLLRSDPIATPRPTRTSWSGSVPL